MEVLKKAQEGWENLMIADEVQTKDFILEKKENYLAAMRYFQCTQTDKEAERHVVKLGVGGGIGSMLAVAWSELLKSKVEAQKHVAVTFEGDLKWYTSNEGCKQNPGYECFFLVQKIIKRIAFKHWSNNVRKPNYQIFFCIFSNIIFGN